MAEKIVALSIGSKNISAAIANDNEGEFTILDTIVRPSKGISKGKIAKVDLAIESVVEVLEELSKMNFEKIPSVYISLGTENIRIVKNTGVYLSEYKNTILTQKEVKKAYINGKNINSENDEYIVDAIIRKVRVNNNEILESPMGIESSSLEIDLDVIIAKKDFIDDVKSMFTRIGCEINGFLLGVESLKQIFLVDNNNANNLIIDFGGEKTEFIYFEDGRVANIGYIPLGGVNITKDLSIVTTYSEEVMEVIKKKNSSSYSTFRNDFAKIEVLEDYVEADLFYDIINARFEEILNYVKKELEYSGVYDKIENITILGDGIGSFEKINLLIEDILQKKVNVFTKNELNIEKSSIITPIAIVKEVYDRVKLLGDDSNEVEVSFKRETYVKEVEEESFDEVKIVKKKGLSKVLGFLGDIF
ncbi:cell division FtsA domain-containing protein [uncultured Clostridium sp.]|uniref:cell division FtsA domain-containing protein n=1 Tax=uncultured Clostridium sp. TaxID=59620 RepID=UPI00262D5B7A|nr:cell division FtsA domain-containing protein [uncultured Clostridium sp.]